MSSMSGYGMVFVAFSTMMLLQSNLNSALTYNDHICYRGKYSANSTFQANLHLLFSTITLDTKPNGHIFINKSAGNDTGAVYALFQCRGDYANEECKKFAGTATDDIKTRCPYRKEAIIFYDECWFHYSNRSLSAVQFGPTIWTVPVLQSGQRSLFTVKLTRLMEQLVIKAVSASTNSFAVGKDDSSVSLSIYGLVQCIQDLSTADCGKCLRKEYEYMNKFSAVVVLNPSCIAMFRPYEFYLAPAQAPPPPSPLPPPPTAGQEKKSSQNVIIIVLPTVIAVLLLSMIAIFIHLRRKKGFKMVKDGAELNPVQSLQFDFATVGAATGDFCDANKLGEGGFGGVYKGMLPDGRVIAVKRLARNSVQGEHEFKNEVVLLSELEHRNIVKLLGFCLEGDEKLLIYEFVPNASLEHYLFDPARVTSLDWERRDKIIRGIARGLLYLHEDSPHLIIHRDIKASNILLDEKMNPKISDFGMARLFMVDQTHGCTKRIVGTLGYMAPEYAYQGHFSVKTDVFSFGVLVLEIISGRKNSRYYESQGDEYLLGYAWKHLLEGTSLELLDPSLGGTYSQTEVIRCIHVGLLCVQEDVAKRPTMESVVVMFNRNTATLPLPSTPAFFVNSATKCDTRSEEHGTNTTYSIQTSSGDQCTSCATLPSFNEVSISELYPR